VSQSEREIGGGRIVWKWLHSAPAVQRIPDARRWNSRHRRLLGRRGAWRWETSTRLIWAAAQQTANESVTVEQLIEVKRIVRGARRCEV